MTDPDAGVVGVFMVGGPYDDEMLYVADPGEELMVLHTRLLTSDAEYQYHRYLRFSERTYVWEERFDD